MLTKEDALAEIDASGVAAHQRWRHWKGHLYTVVGTGIVEASMDPVVMYAGADGIVWVRALHVFLEEVKSGVPRFTRCAPDARLCPFSEESCKAGDCAEHGLFPSEPAQSMLPRTRGGRYL